MEKNIEFKVGDKVKIRKDSKYYGESSSNLTDVLGEVNSIYPHFALPIRVEWSTGYLSYYRSCDLELVKDGLDKEQYSEANILAIRDRIYKIDEDLMALRNERAGLVKKLQDEGLALVDKEELDLTDHMNWKEGDTVEFVGPDYPGSCFTKGDLYVVESVDSDTVHVLFDDEGDYNGWKAEYFRFVERT